MSSTSRIVTPKDTIVRPGDTDNYAAKDAVSDSTSAPTNLQFRVGRGTRGGIIRSVFLGKSGTGTTNLGFRLFLFDTAPAAVEDNAAWDPSDVEIATMLPGGGIDFADGDEDQNSSNNIHWNETNLCIPFEPDSAGLLYGHFVTKAAYNPANGETFYFRLGVELF